MSTTAVGKEYQDCSGSRTTAALLPTLFDQPGTATLSGQRSPERLRELKDYAERERSRLHRSDTLAVIDELLAWVEYLEDMCDLTGVSKR